MRISRPPPVPVDSQQWFVFYVSWHLNPNHSSARAWCDGRDPAWEGRMIKCHAGGKPLPPAHICAKARPHDREWSPAAGLHRQLSAAHHHRLPPAVTGCRPPSPVAARHHRVLFHQPWRGVPWVTPPAGVLRGRPAGGLMISEIRPRYALTSFRDHQMPRLRDGSGWGGSRRVGTRSGSWVSVRYRSCLGAGRGSHKIIARRSHGPG